MTWVLIPAKGIPQAKSRLSPVLNEGERGRLALSMLDNVLGAVSTCPAIERIVVVTNCPQVRAHAQVAGAMLESDPSDPAVERPRLAHVVDHGLRRISREGAAQALIVMGDLPLLTAEDVAAVANRITRRCVALAPDRWGTGTNALGLPLAGREPTHFGRADSLDRHRAAFARAGVAVEQVVRPGFAFDVDTPEDLSRMGLGPGPVRLPGRLLGG